jgi:group I intron endonuclease
MTGIYAIKHLESGKLYVGSAIDIRKRWTEHRKTLKKETHHSSLLQRAWNKYGKDAFVFVVLEEVYDMDRLIEREQYWINKTQSCIRGVGYNICINAGNRLGMRHTIEAKQKISLANTGRVHTQEQREKMIEALKGLKRTPEQRGRQSERMMGHALSNGTKQKIRDKAIGRSISKETRETWSKQRVGAGNGRSVLTEKDIPLIRERLATGEATLSISKSYGVERSTINNIKRGKSWRHIKDGPLTYPEKRGNNKITSSQAGEIKELLLNGIPRVEITKLFNISKSAIDKIAQGKTWTDNTPH